MRTDQQIVNECNELARKFYSSLGYTAPAGYRFDQAKHPTERVVWALAAMAYEHIAFTEVDDALAAVEDEAGSPAPSDMPSAGRSGT